MGTSTLLTRSSYKVDVTVAVHARVDAADSVGQTVSTSPRVDTEAGEISVQRRVASSVVKKKPRNNKSLGRHRKIGYYVLTL